MFIKFSIRSLKQIKRTLQKGYCKQNVHTYLSIYLSIYHSNSNSNENKLVLK